MSSVLQSFVVQNTGEQDLDEGRQESLIRGTAKVRIRAYRLNSCRRRPINTTPAHQQCHQQHNSMNVPTTGQRTPELYRFMGQSGLVQAKHDYIRRSWKNKSSDAKPTTNSIRYFKCSESPPKLLRRRQPSFSIPDFSYPHLFFTNFVHPSPRYSVYLTPVIAAKQLWTTGVICTSMT
jgi:hypothetical protein